ncbi:M23 family metallopeptidase [Brevibacillus sp. SYSU BS000544]|uniref:M23 family metallopeptidase n=1 Tax=Brevibacillus sp. SYSU BS000544 TaxID=3416443 RepID=UPI003CE52F58
MEAQDGMKEKIKKKVKNQVGSLVIMWGGPTLFFVLFLMLIVFMIFLLFLPLLILAPENAFRSDDGYYTGEVPENVDVDGTSYIWPVPNLNQLSTYFGEVRDFDTVPHKGIDIIDPRGASFTAMQPVYAMAAGVVTRAGAADGYGQAIYIDHGNGLLTRYGHLEVGEMSVSEGDNVAKGGLIGRIGKGKVGTSTGPHLHFQVEENGDPVNPLKYVKPPTFIVSADISYKPMAIPEMKAWLEKRDSALADERILQSIDKAAQAENVSPYVLISITGQEQSFVKKDHPNADQIIKNPWNVFGCWCSGKGATLTTEEAAQIAARTVAKLAQDCPAGMSPFQWMVSSDNPRGVYAEDSGWWIGVSRFYNAILEEMPE